METYIYIKKSQPGKFLEFSEEFNDDLFNNIGDSWESYEAGKWVLLSPEQVNFHKKHPSASEKEVWDMKLTPKGIPAPILPEEPENEPTPEIETPLERKLKEITEYSDVYSFTLGNKEMWIDAQERREILDLVTAYRASKEKEMTKWIDGTEYTFTLVQWTKLARRLDVYANKVENVKNTHKKNISELEDNYEIENYDYTVGYPDKLNFDEL